MRARLRAEAGLEDALDQFGRNARAIVGDGDERDGHRHQPDLGRAQVLTALHPNGALPTGGVGRVVDQVHQDLQDARAVDASERRLAVARHLQRDCRRGQPTKDGFQLAGVQANVNGPIVVERHAAGLHQIGGRGEATLSGVEDLEHQRAGLAAVHLVVQINGTRLDDREDVAEVVSDGLTGSCEQFHLAGDFLLVRGSRLGTLRGEPAQWRGRQGRGQVSSVQRTPASLALP